MSEVKTINCNQLKVRKVLKHPENSNFTPTEDFLLQALDLDHLDPEASMMLANIYSVQGRLERAEALYKEILYQYPNEAGAQIGLGELYLKLGEFFPAEDCFREALIIDRKNGKAWNYLGVIYTVSGDYKRAEHYYRWGMEFGCKEAEFNLGALFLEQERLEEAKSIFQPLMQITKYQTEATLNMGYIYLKEGKFSTSLELLNQADKMLDNELKRLYSAGLGHYYNGQYQKASNYFRSALEINPNYFPARNALQSCKLRNLTMRQQDLEFDGGTCTKIKTKNEQDAMEQYLNSDFQAEREADMVSILILTSLKDRALEKSLNRSLLLDYPKYEIIILPDREILLDQRGYKVIPTGRVDITMKMRRGYKVAQGEYLVFIEKGASPDQYWLNRVMSQVHNGTHTIVGKLGNENCFIIRKNNFRNIEKYLHKSQDLRQLFQTLLQRTQKSDLKSNLMSFIFNNHLLGLFKKWFKKMYLTIDQQGEMLFCRFDDQREVDYRDQNEAYQVMEPKLDGISWA